MGIAISDEIKTFWKRFVESDPAWGYLKDYKIEAWSFGNTKEMADELVGLVLEGKKTATCSLLRAYRGYENEIPRVGVYSLICDGNNHPKCIVFYTDTFICKFNEVNEKQAYEEGEGDRTLNYWRAAHLDFFSSDKDFREDDELLCERFRVVYK